MHCLEWLKLLYYWLKGKLIKPYTDKHVTQDKDGHTVHYILNDQEYKIFVPNKRRNVVLYITDDTGAEVTDHVKPFLGPNRDCYIPPTPRQLGYKGLQIETATKTLVYSSDQPIMF